ncbi:MAG: hypothetical protein ACRD3S_16330, partial [Terracidiphilus sp.]
VKFSACLIAHITNEFRHLPQFGWGLRQDMGTVHPGNTLSSKPFTESACHIKGRAIEAEVFGRDHA